MSDPPVPEGPGPNVHDLPTLEPPPEAGQAGSTVTLLGAVPQEFDSERVRVPGYELLRELGRGAMGVVYLARQTRLNRLTAIKVILAGGHASATDLARFHAEAESIARLQHPNIIQIYEVGLSEGRPFLALEYAGGGTLAGRLGGRPQAPAEAARLGVRLAQAVQAAHEHGVIHRDLKPGNVLLGSGPETSLGESAPKITDFGLAKRTDVAGMTASGAVVGTPSYMAPEQAAGDKKEVGPAADVYALGAILYELLTGRPPFLGATTMDTLMQVLSVDPVPLRRLQPQVPRDLETITLKCLQKDPRKRYASAAELADDLERFLDGRPIKARPVGPLERLARWCRRNPALAALSATVAALLVGTSILSTLAAIRIERARTEAVRSAEAKEDALEQLSGALKRERDAFVAVDQARSRAVDREREALRRKQEAEEEQARAQASLYFNSVSLAERYWSANSTDLAEGKLERCPPILHHWEWHYLKRLCQAARHSATSPETGTASAVALNPDGQRVATAYSDQVPHFRVDQWAVKVWDGQTGAELLELQDDNTFAPLHAVAFDPTGKRLAVASAARVVNVWSKIDQSSRGPTPLVLKGHGGACLGVAFGPSGRRLATCSADRTVRLWDAEKGRPLAVLKGHTREVHTAVFSPNGKRLASGGADNTVRIWDVAPGKPAKLLFTLIGHRGHVRGLAFGPGGKQLASCSLDGTIKVWDIQHGKFTLACAGHAGPVNAVAFSPDGKRLASAGDDQVLKVWDSGTGKELFTLRGHKGAVHALAYRASGRELVSVGRDRTFKVWDAATGGQGLHLSGNRSAVAFAPDNRQVATASEGVITVWSVPAGRARRTLRGHRGKVVKMAFSPDGRRLLSASAFLPAAGKPGAVPLPEKPAVELKVWDLHRGRALLTREGQPDGDVCVAFSPDGKRLAAAVGQRKVRLWDTAGKGPPRTVLVADVQVVRALAFSRDGRLLAVAGGQGRLADLFQSPQLVVIFDTNTWKIRWRCHGHGAAIRAVAFCPARKGRAEMMATGGDDKVVQVWELPAESPEAEPWSLREPRSRLEGHTRGIRGLAFSPDGLRLVSVSAEQAPVAQGGARAPQRPTGEVKVWDLAWGQEVLTLPVAAGDAAFSPNGAHLAVAGKDGLVRVWDGTPQRERFTSRAAGTSVSLGRSGRLLAVASEGESVVLWDVQQGRRIRRLRSKGGEVVRRVAFSADGRRLATAGDEGSVRIWEVSSGRLLHTCRGHRDTVFAVAFSADGKRLASAGADETVRVWDARTGKEVFVYRGHTDRVLGVAFSPDGKSIASCGEDRMLLVWASRTGRLRFGGVEHQNWVNAVAFSPDGTLVASAGEDGTTRLWDARCGKSVRILRQHTDAVRDLSFSPDSKRLATAGWDHTVKVWDLRSWRMLLSLPGHEQGATAVSFGADARQLASADASLTVHVWDAEPARK
jgi:WD40 repeat protein